MTLNREPHHISLSLRLMWPAVCDVGRSFGAKFLTDGMRDDDTGALASIFVFTACVKKLHRLKTELHLIATAVLSDRFELVVLEVHVCSRLMMAATTVSPSNETNRKFKR